jgi:hypothetical protein
MIESRGPQMEQCGCVGEVTEARSWMGRWLRRGIDGGRKMMGEIPLGMRIASVRYKARVSLTQVNLDDGSIITAISAWKYSTFQTQIRAPLHDKERAFLTTAATRDLP